MVCLQKELADDQTWERKDKADLMGQKDGTDLMARKAEVIAEFWANACIEWEVAPSVCSISLRQELKNDLG